MQQPYRKGRGAQINTPNPYHAQYLDEAPQTPEEWKDLHTQHTEFIVVHPRTMLNRVDSPDIGLCYSMNPYQGCEHGCTYCYARNTHTYWGYSAGVDFEQKILVKTQAAQVLDIELGKKTYRPLPIMLSGNTDCYQPAERQFGITRQILEVLWKHRHPVGIITKNSLVLRDLDLLKQMAEHGLVKVSISLTTLQEEVRQLLEPRAASVKSRLGAIQTLTSHGIPVNVMLAPIIPGLTDQELLPMAEKAAALGAASIGYQIVRLNGDVAAIFEDWVRKAMPDRAKRILNRIRDCHGGQLHDSRFGTRMSGEGNVAEVIAQQFALAKRRYFKGKSVPPYNFQLFEQKKNPQGRLFD